MHGGHPMTTISDILSLRFFFWILRVLWVALVRHLDVWQFLSWLSRQLAARSALVSLFRFSFSFSTYSSWSKREGHCTIGAFSHSDAIIDFGFSLHEHTVIFMLSLSRRCLTALRFHSRQRRATTARHRSELNVSRQRLFLPFSSYLFQPFLQSADHGQLCHPCLIDR
jgi:hypothetical protein